MERNGREWKEMEGNEKWRLMKGSLFLKSEKGQLQACRPGRRRNDYFNNESERRKNCKYFHASWDNLERGLEGMKDMEGNGGK